jgi:hypothetical protein
MQEALKKLGLKKQSPILLYHVPPELVGLFAAYEGEKHGNIRCTYTYIMAFVSSSREAVSLAGDLAAALEEDGRLWLSYPKPSSKHLQSDLNREKAWDLFASYQLEPVSQISLNDDWTAIRFRQVDYIKKMTRKNAATARGKERIERGGHPT